MKRIDFPVGRTTWELQVRPEDLIEPQRAIEPAPIADVRAAVREAVDHPLRFEPLRRALTPDDRIAIVVDESLPQLAELLEPILDHLLSAGITPDRVTLLSAESGSDQRWLDDLPEAFEEVCTETHDPANRDRLSYLATSKDGHRLYLNKTMIDADQLIVLSGRGYDPLFGYSGAETAIFPAFGDAASRHGNARCLSMAVPGTERWALRQEAAEIVWLMGAPFFVQVIEGRGDTIAYVCGGLGETAEDGRLALEKRWHVRVDRPADTVIASITGDPARHGFTEMARAVACASRVVAPGGCVVLLSESEPNAREAGELLSSADSPERALKRLTERKAAAMPAAFQWASAASQTRVYLCCDCSPDAVEDWFATAITSPAQVQRLLDSPGTCLFLPDAHKTLASVGSC